MQKGTQCRFTMFRFETFENWNLYLKSFFLHSQFNFDAALLCWNLRVTIYLWSILLDSFGQTREFHSYLHTCVFCTHTHQWSGKGFSGCVCVHPSQTVWRLITIFFFLFLLFFGGSKILSSFSSMEGKKVKWVKLKRHAPIDSMRAVRQTHTH